MSDQIDRFVSVLRRVSLQSERLKHLLNSSRIVTVIIDDQNVLELA